MPGTALAFATAEVEATETCRVQWLRTHQVISRSLSQLHWQQLESDEGRVVGFFVLPWLSAKDRVKALVATFIKPSVFFLAQENCSSATRRALSKGCDEA